jgi:glycogen operon protein
MVLAGDELSQTQQGNNNTYCQDNEITWLHWDLTDAQQAFCDFVRAVVHLQRTQPVFQRRKFFLGRAIYGAGIQDIMWFEPSGEEMSEEAWQTGEARCLGVRLAGDCIGDVDERGESVVGDTILVLMNAHHEGLPFTLPATAEGQVWECVLDTAVPEGDAPLPYAGEQPYALQGRSIAVLRIRTLQEEVQPSPATTSAAER